MLQQSNPQTNSQLHIYQQCNQQPKLAPKYYSLLKSTQEKDIKLSLETSQKINSMKASSETSESSVHSSQIFHIFSVLETLLKKRYSSFFSISNSAAKKKFLLLCLVNKICQHSSREAFQKLKNNVDNQSINIFKEIDQRLRAQLFFAFLMMKKQAKSPLDSVPSLKAKIENNSNLQQLKKELKIKRFSNVNWLTRRNMELEMKNDQLKNENIRLKGLVEELSRRQMKENMKKQKNLQMFAQETAQKNGIIKELQSIIRLYESKYQAYDNIKKEQSFFLKKEVDKLSRSNTKYQQEITKLNTKIQILEQNEKIHFQKIQKLQQENYHFQKRYFHNENKQNLINSLQSSLNSLIAKFHTKLRKLQVYEQILTQQKKGIKNGVSPQTSQIKEEAKAELILCFLSNIDVPQYQFPSLALFDEEEEQVLVNHQILYQKYSNDSNTLGKLNKNKRKDEEDEGSERTDSFGRMEDKKTHGNLSIKLLQIQLEKNKQISRISELKDKIMHIRIIVLNLLRSLDLKQKMGLFRSVKSQTQGIISILFDIFQYSEEEREEVFSTKRKKFFGIL